MGNATPASMELSETYLVKKSTNKKTRLRNLLPQLAELLKAFRIM